MEKQAFSKLMVAILLMVFVFALGNLVFNLENLYIGEENVPVYLYPDAAASQNVATNNTLSSAIKLIWYGFLVFCGFAVIASIVTFGTDKDKKKWRKLFYQILSVLLIFGLIFAFAYFYDDIESSTMGGLFKLPDGSSGEVASANTTTEPPANPDTLKVVITFGIFAILFMFCIIVFIAISNVVKMRNSKLDYSDIERDTQEVAQTIQRTIDALAGGSDTRATVIRCYTDMCKVMSKYGVKEEEYLTPREFQKLAQDNLPIPEEQMRALVDIFEEARYSKHKLSETDSQRAVKALEAVKEKLLAYKPTVSVEGVKSDGL